MATEDPCARSIDMRVPRAIIVAFAMGVPSVSCLFYLFADSAELGIRQRLRLGPQAAIPGSATTVPLGPLELLLVRAAIWELVMGGNLKASIDLIPVEPWRLSRSRTRTQLNLYRQPFAAVPPPSGSLAEELFSGISVDRTSPVIAVIDWAGGRWPLPLDSIVAVAVREALNHGVLIPAFVGSARGRHRWARSQSVVVPTLEADVDALNALRPAFEEAWTCWDSYYDDDLEVDQRMERECRSALASLRLSYPGAGSAGGPG